ncbi:MAG: deoxyguanosinetriphosphate triphosphohydrolase [Candidatus Omnitrophica bacterium]|nr:deoxyguanosinetriphosphate triphosphohydrolase [Candidatus Omnitrophota bacterium]
MRKSNYIEEFESRFLAPYAQKSSRTRGRQHKEKEHTYRGCYQRDRDRVIHSAAFRRLEYKTQVFVNHEGDYYRTRLTHTLEVSQIARTIAWALRLNVDLVEAISLAHDLGHTPFGHAGEEALNDLMRDYGGFNHNAQSLRVVDLLEEKYPDFPGLNLTWEVREGIAKHMSAYDTIAGNETFEPDKLPALETQVVDIADEIAYDNHDLDDGITSGLIQESELKKVSLWRDVFEGTWAKHRKLDPQMRKYLMIRSLIDIQVTDLINNSRKKLKEFAPSSPDDAKGLKEKIIVFSDDIKERRLELRRLLIRDLYRHYRVLRMSHKAKRFITELFNLYLESPEQLPVSRKGPASTGSAPALDQPRGSQEDTRRMICDYIAAMTDRCALDEHKKLFDPHEKV